MTATFRLIALVPLLSLAAAAAFAAHDPKAVAKSAAVPRVLEAGTAPSRSAAKRPPLTADQKALEHIMQRGQAEVATLTQGLQSMPLGPAREAVERKVVETKLRYRVEFLRALAGQQRAKGDLTAALTTDAIIDQLVNPKPLPLNTEPQSPNRPGAVR